MTLTLDQQQHPDDIKQYNLTLGSKSKDPFKYSRTSVARTLMACLPFLSHRKVPTAADIIIFEIMQIDFLYYIDTDMLCVLIRISSMRRF